MKKANQAEQVEIKQIGQAEACQEINYLGKIGECIRVHGSISKIRKMSGFAFVLLRTGREILQMVWDSSFSAFPLEVLKEEACIRAEVRVVEEARSHCGFELRMLSAEVLSEPAFELPFAVGNKEVGTSLEKLLDYRPLTLRNEKERAIFRIQAGICTAIRQYLDSQGFTEVHTPKIVSEGAEGGANIFKLDYFGKQAYLAQSPQFYKQMMVGVFERVYEIGPVFRAEKHDTSRHLNEYTSVDFEMGYLQSFEEIMEMETGMIAAILRFLEEHFGKELKLLQVDMPACAEIPAIRFCKAKELLGTAARGEDDFEPEEEKRLCEIIKEQTGSEFVFVTHYPTSKRPFYAMECPDNPEETLSFDLLFRGLEITTGGQRIHDWKQQVEKMERRQMNPEQFAGYLMLHRYGIPPHGGLGLGLERFTARLLKKENVRAASLFPRDIKRLVP